MITAMTKYSFILLDGQQEGLLEKLQELGLMDITRSAKPVDETSGQIMTEVELANAFIEGLNKAEIPDGTVPERIDGDIIRLAGGMIMRYNKDRDSIRRLEKEIAAVKVWGKFNPEILSKLKEAGIPIHFHVIARKLFKEEWADEYALSVIAEDKNSVWFAVAGEDALPGEIPAPTEDISLKEKELEDTQRHFDKVISRLSGAKERIGELEAYKAQKLSELDLHLASVAAVPAAEGTIVTLEGYAPTESDATLCNALDELGVFYLKEEAKAADNPPVKLKNNWFARQFEVLTDMYGRPVYDEFDPTPILGPFFLLFFAMCMGDAGYGILLLLIGWFLKKKVPSMADMAPLVMILGVGTFVVGIVLHTFFGINLYEAAWVPEWLKKVMISGSVAGYDAQMVLAVGVGVFHICLAMTVKCICYTRRFGFAKTIGSWGWTLLIVGGIVTGGLALLGIIDTPAVKIILIVLGIVSGLAIYLLNDLHRNPLLNVGSGLWETYNTVTGLLGDVLSYLRLYALGLAGAKLGEAFNAIGVQALGDGGINWVFFILIVVVGHVLNIAMCILGAFVHPLRLNFLEFFKNSGYEGSGRRYKPLQS